MAEGYPQKGTISFWKVYGNFNFEYNSFLYTPQRILSVCPISVKRHYWWNINGLTSWLIGIVKPKNPWGKHEGQNATTSLKKRIVSKEGADRERIVSGEGARRKEKESDAGAEKGSTTLSQTLFRPFLMALQVCLPPPHVLRPWDAPGTVRYISHHFFFCSCSTTPF